MLSNLSEFKVLLERYGGDTGFCSKILRTHAHSDPKTFLVYARKALAEDRSPALLSSLRDSPSRPVSLKLCSLYTPGRAKRLSL